MYLIKSGITLFYVWTGVSTCKIEFHNIIFIFIIFSFRIFSDHIVLVFKLYQTILNYNITHIHVLILTCGNLFKIKYFASYLSKVAFSIFSNLD